MVCTSQPSRVNGAHGVLHTHTNRSGQVWGLTLFLVPAGLMLRGRRSQTVEVGGFITLDTEINISCLISSVNWTLFLCRLTPAPVLFLLFMLLLRVGWLVKGVSTWAASQKLLSNDPGPSLLSQSFRRAFATCIDLAFAEGVPFATMHVRLGLY